ncbi:MAG: hypothetical protein F2667_02255 [Actinobacteria bacterium]|uniref:Unannotated protein n=1 Tax=freshwater metagenome TaxID=449393 RepID=A0A6J6NWU2_9ZZZZ|nr:hypothetical protein [Actinomycetota bacterium]
METLRLILLFVHVLGFAALIGGLLAQAGEASKRVNSAMRDGAGTAVVAGVALAGVLSAGDQDPDTTKIAVKLLIGVVILALVMANLRTEISQRLWLTILLLSIANVAVAIFWSPAHHWV